MTDSPNKPPRSTETAIAILEVQFSNVSARLLEIAQTLGANHLDVKKDIEALTNSVSNNYATKAEHSDLKSRVDKMSEGIGWVLKIVGGAIIVALMGVILVKGAVSVPIH